MVTGVFVVAMGFGDFAAKSGPPGGVVVAVLGLVTIWSFGKAFFNFPDYRNRQ